MVPGIEKGVMMRQFYEWLTGCNGVWAGDAIKYAAAHCGLSEKQTRNALTRLVTVGAMDTNGAGYYTWN